LTVLQGNELIYVTTIVGPSGTESSANFPATTQAIANLAAGPSTIVTIPYAATVTPNFLASTFFEIVLTGNVTIANPTGITAPAFGEFTIVQDGTGSRTATWGSYWKWPNGSAPTLSTGANAVDVISFYVRNGTFIVGQILSNAS